MIMMMNIQKYAEKVKYSFDDADDNQIKVVFFFKILTKQKNSTPVSWYVRDSNAHKMFVSTDLRLQVPPWSLLFVKQLVDVEKPANMEATYTRS